MRVLESINYRPSIVERPRLRFRFLDPDGCEQQVSLCSTWIDIPGKNGSMTTNPDASALHYRKTIHDVAALFCERFGCTLLSIDQVTTNIQEVMG